jgi:brefeldin A-resistance guanine nucleotide exchange factor 1
VRLLAFNSLQRSLLSADVTCNDHKEWTAIFGEVLFPLINKLLKPEVFSSDREGMGEMRVQTSSLLCKVFLQCLVLLSEIDGLLDLWIQIIDIMDRLMNSGQGDSLVCFLPPAPPTPIANPSQEDAVRENLKNVLLFMASSEHLVPPSKDPSKETFWNETWKRIDRFVPDLRNDLALEEPASEKQAEKAEEPAAVPQTQEKQEA